MDTNEKDLIAKLETMTATQQKEWFRENLDEAYSLFCWLIGYAGLSKLNLTSTEAEGA